MTYELAMRYARSLGGDVAADVGAEAPPVPQDVYPALWRAAWRGDIGPKLDAFGRLADCAKGRETIIVAFALGPTLTDRRLAGLLRSFGEDVIGQQLAAKGMGDPDETGLLTVCDAAGEDADVIAAPYVLGCCIMRARQRQRLMAGDFGAEPRIAAELGTTPYRRRVPRGRRW